MTRLAICLAMLCGALSAQAQVSVQSPLSDDRTVSPGTTYDGTVLVVNETAESQQVRLYLTDYRFTADGRNEYGPPGVMERSNADWIEFGPRVLTLAPYESKTFAYRVRVPTDLDAPGSYWSMLMVEAISGEGDESAMIDARGNRRGGISPITRYGIQVATHVPGGEPAFSFEQVALTEDDRAILHVDIANHGTRLASAAVSIEVFSNAGELLWQHGSGRSRIYPGTSVRQLMDLSELPAGTYEALILIDAGGDVLTGAQYTINL